MAFNHADEKVYVADTYNHKIKAIDTETNTINTLNIKNDKGELIVFNEPSGLSVDASGSNLLVADTNNHHIYIIDLETLVAKPFNLDFGQLSATSETDAAAQPSQPAVELTKVIPILRHKNSKINFVVKLSSELKFTDEAPQKWRMKRVNPSLEILRINGLLKDGEFSIELTHSGTSIISGNNDKESDLIVEFVLSLCDAKCCLMKRFSLAINSEGDSDEPAGNLNQNIEIHIANDKISLA